MTKRANTRVLVVVFDALRPEFLNADLMPNLSAFAESGVRYANSRSTYPTETRVNQSAVITGCLPRSHGIVGNAFVANDLEDGSFVDTGNDHALEQAMTSLPDGVLKRPTLAQYLLAHNYSFASLSTGTPGGGRLINHRAEQDGLFRFAMKRPEAAAPQGVCDDIIAAIGPITEFRLPAKEWITWGVDAYLTYIEKEVRPDVMLLWLCEPDESFHRLGIGSPASLETISNADAEFGRIIETHNSAIARGDMNVVAMSDHGQTTLVGDPVDLPAQLSKAGFSSLRKAVGEALCTVSVTNAGGIWLRQPDQTVTDEIIHWLREQSWCGPLFTKNGAAGTLLQSEIACDHPRAPDISIVMRASDAPNQWGYSGTTRHDASYPVGGGCHGGLSKEELCNVLMLAGASFKKEELITLPASNIDILPTILSLFSITPLPQTDGRLLCEAFAGASNQANDAEVTRQCRTSSHTSGPRTQLKYTTFDGTR